PAAPFANWLEQARRQAAPQQIIEDSETEAVLVIKRNRRNPDANMRLLEIALFFEQDGRLRVGRAAIVGSPGRPERTELTPHQLQHPVVGHVPGGGDDQMVRRKPIAKT